MTIAVTAIKQRIVDLMKADSAFDALPLFIQGVPYRVATQYYPFAMIVVTAETTTGRTTGNRHQRAYDGLVQFEALVQDIWSVTDREAIVPSFATIDVLVNACVDLFKQAANQRLNNLTFDGGAVDNFLIGEFDIEYGISPDTERPDGLYNFGTVPWQCLTWEVFP